MAATGLLALIDDITSILDDVAAMSKVAAKQTAGIAGDDLAVNAQGLVGIDPSRELPIVGKVALGSALNKVVLVPLALVLPHAAITPLLMLGGTYLCYEGLHKVLHRHDHEDEQHHAELVKAIQTSPEALAKVEAGKIRQAILTDVVLSAEIVAVALSAVSEAPFSVKATTLVVVSFGMTIAIYGLVAGLVKLDDIGLHLQQRGGVTRARVGRMLVDGAPKLLKAVSVIGTVAMFLVGGGIVLHGIPGAEEALHHQLEAWTHNGLVQALLTNLAGLLMGLVVGGVAMLLVGAVQAVVRRMRPKAAAGH